MEKMIEAALNAGAVKATIIPVEQIVLSPKFRDICRSNGCGLYGQCWMCPPDVGDIEPLMAQVRSYTHGLLYQTITPLEDSFDIEGMMEGKKNHTQLGQRLEKSGVLPKKRLHLGCGGCNLCERCAKRDNLPCRYPENALSSMEAYGIDVYNTTKGTELKYINGPDTVIYFGIVLF